MADMTKTGNPDQIPDEPANRDIAKAASAKEKAPLTFAEKVEALDRFIHFEPLIREIDYKVLLFCENRRDLAAIEEEIATFPEFAGATRDQYHLITELVDHGGLEYFELDGAGAVVTAERKAGLTENEVDDLVAGFAYRTTEVGRAVAERLDPRRRLADLVAAAPERAPLYEALLAFLRDKRSFAEVDTYLRGPEGFALCCETGTNGMQPSVFVDKLERAGVLAFNHGWQTTEAGLAALENGLAA